MNVPWVKHEIFINSERTAIANTTHFEIKVPFITNLPIPPCIFVQCFRDTDTTPTSQSTFENPSIVKLDLFMPEYNGFIKSLGDLDENALYHLTRKNSNFRANHVSNRKLYGAILLKKGDIGNLTQYLGTERIDNFSGTFTLRVNDSANQVNWPGNYKAKVTFLYYDYGLNGTLFESNFAFL